ncbi:heparinase II/III-like protein [Methyloglobulus morosus KoM1]|uniref:Heparinase II/III-like protein n=1 Tax=Methyloglobulus morosus KoM1 TaxID=1116472 RepID=V5BSQ9_9GAMM|nr:alginate lyase family protein [Methyloglobulus morosus]ESS67573.1 heparinase II/III-like protein [Methyloglobulus morosus KoM1]
MSAVPAIDNSCHSEVLKAPFNTWTPSELLAYFQSRTGIAYFAIANEPEVTREKIDGILSDNFNLNEESYQFTDRLDWLTNPSNDVEWAIMLHKFYYAVGLGLAFKETGDRRYADKWVDLTSSWIKTVPIDFLPSDVSGRRIQNWIFAHYYFVSKCPTEAITPEFYVQFLESIHQQTSHLCQNLTPARNHRTLELYTIFLVAVVFPELKGADAWLQFSIDELTKNAQTDLLADGVHCELSTDYHHIVLRNFLAVKRLAVLNNISLPPQLDGCIRKALVFSTYVHKPDGFIPSLSDGDTGNFLPLLQQGYDLYGCEEMLYVATKGKQGTAPKHRSKAFPSGGYYILRSGWGESLEAYEDERYLVFDCGDLGAGNHGHLDLLSFEMAAYGQSLIVDPGRYTYDESGETNWRVLFRGTSYHNTVLVDGLNQTRYEFHKQKFKIKGQQPEYALKAFISQLGFDYLHGIAHSHEYPVVHERKILFIKGEYWVICDVLRADDVHNYDLLFHLAASAQGKVSISCDKQSFSVDAPNLVMIQPVRQSATVSLEGGYVSPTYGIKQDAPVLKFNQHRAECSFYTVIYPYKDERPGLTVSSIPVSKREVLCNPFSAACLSITVERAGQLHNDMIFVANEEGEFATANNTFNTPIYFQRTTGQGKLLAQFDYPSMDNIETICQGQNG